LKNRRNREVPAAVTSASAESGHAHAPALVRPSTTRLDWKLVAILTALGAVIGWSLAAVQPPQYRASALAAITPRPEGLEPNELLRGIETLERRTIVATMSALPSTAAMRTQLGAGSDDDIEALVLPNTNLLRIDVRGGDAMRAATLANRIPALLDVHATSMFKYYRVTMISPAVQPEAPFLPRTGRAITAGTLIGLFAGLLAAYAVQRLRDHAR
jgi:polysaccharide biosynthesis transport protein